MHMKCKHCQAELEETMKFCPACGTEQKAEPAEEIAQEEVVLEEVAPEAVETVAPEIKEGVKATPGKIALAVVAGVLVLALLVTIVIGGLVKFDDKTLEYTEEITPAETVAQEEVTPATEGTIPPDGNPEDVTCKGSYTVTEEELNASADTVVAVVGDAELTNAMLQVYYWEGIYAFDSEYGSYASMFGLDLSQSLDTQLCETGDVSLTWQQYFLDYALGNWHSHQAMAQEGAANDYVVTDALKAEVESISEQLDQMVTAYGYADKDALIRDYVGPGCTTQDYIDYLELYYRGYGYYEHLYETTDVTSEEVEAYFTENEGAYADGGVTKDAGKAVDVRHILLMPENGTTGADGYPVYSDEDWEACRQKAQAIFDEWLAGDKSEESFAQYAMEYSEDGNAAQGGIYEGVTQGYMVEAFDSWCFDESRLAGDYGLVKTQYGYHLMFFVGSQDLWFATAKTDLLAEKLSAFVPMAMENFPMTVDYSAIKLGALDLVNG